MIKYQAKIFLSIVRERGVGPALSMMKQFYQSRPLLINKIQGVQNEFGVDDPGVGAEKYLDVNVFLLEAYRRAFLLRLDLKPPKRILDLGTGAGYFPWVCNRLGHDVEAIDLDNNSMYNALVEALEVRRYAHEIKSEGELPVNKTYELITAFMICFNGHHTNQLWGVCDWQSFLRTLATYCSQDSEIFLSFNIESSVEPISPRLDEYLRSNSSKASGLEYQIAVAKVGSKA